MNKLFVLLLSVICLSSCNSITEMDKQLYEDGEDTIPITSLNQLDEIDHQEESSDRTNVSKLLLRASGFEPGWFAERLCRHGV